MSEVPYAAALENSVALEALDTLAMQRLAGCERRPLLFGLCGAQGSGKSTMTTAFRARLERGGVRTAALSIDDIYKTKAERHHMARELHPLFSTRGVPGTHDVQLLWHVLQEIQFRKPVRLPRFDKSIDDRAPESSWDTAQPDTEVLIFEGWCVGVRQSSDCENPLPINALEEGDDRDGRWRQSIERFIEQEYQPLFTRLDSLALLAPPAFDVVHDWRLQQEEELRAQGGTGMADREIGRFIQHYERLTRRILRNMPDYADLVVRLDAERRPIKIEWQPNQSSPRLKGSSDG